MDYTLEDFDMVDLEDPITYEILDNENSVFIMNLDQIPAAVCSTYTFNSIFADNIKKHKYVSLDKTLQIKITGLSIETHRPTQIETSTFDCLSKENQNLLEKTIKQNHIYVCVKGNCDGFKEKKYFSNDFWFWRCKLCSTIQCAKCQVEKHDGMSCEEFQQKIQKIDNYIEAQQENKQMQKCPKCKVAYEKSEGCNTMSCPTCHIKFCWRCGIKLPEDEVKAHEHFAMNSGSKCSGMLFTNPDGKYSLPTFNPLNELIGGLMDHVLF